MKKLWTAVLATLAAIGGWVGFGRNIPKLDAMPAPVLRLVGDTLYVAIAPSIPNIDAPNALDSAAVDFTSSPDLPPVGDERRRWTGPVFPVPVEDTVAYYVGDLAPGTVITGSVRGYTYRRDKASGATVVQWPAYTLPGTPIDTNPPPAMTIPPPVLIGPDSMIGTLPDTLDYYGLQLWIPPRVLRAMAVTPVCTGTGADFPACRQAMLDSFPQQADRQMRWGCGFVGAIDTGQTWTVQFHVGSYPDTAGAWANCDTFLAATGLDALAEPMHTIRTNLETGVYLAHTDSPVGWLSRFLVSR